VDPTQNGRSAHGARKSAVFGKTVRSLMLVLLTTSHPAWLPVAWAQPVKLLPPVAMDNSGNFVVVWESFGRAGTDRGKYSIGVQGQHGDGDPNNQAEPAAAMDSAGNLVVVWLSDGEPRVGHRSTALLGYSADTSPGRERRVGREIQETSAQPPHGAEFMKSHVPSLPIHPSPSSSWNGGSRLP
jgi:hypothetical protein